jgi:hypothetical protein
MSVKKVMKSNDVGEKFPVQAKMSDMFLSKILERSNGGVFMLYFDTDGNIQKFIKGKNPVYDAALDREIDKYVKDRDSVEGMNFFVTNGDEGSE